MANYIISYDLNGPKPSHTEMDKHMESAGWTRARVLETVWYVGTAESRSEVYRHINKILSKNDQIIVLSASGAMFRNLLVDNDDLTAAWDANV